MAAIAGGMVAWSAPAAAGLPPLRTLDTAEAIAQVAAGGPTGLLAVGAGGALFALPPEGGHARRLAEGIDPATPLAVGHGRIAARRRDGALWVQAAGRSSVSSDGRLARAAGLLMLPLAVIGVEVEGARHRVVRFEPTGAGVWSRVARSEIEVLPDARPLQADVDGAGDGGHVVVLAGPDAQRYRHAVLGDAVEATRLVVLERHGLEVMRELMLDAPHVLEDIAPRRVSLGASDGLLTVRSGPQGGQLVLFDADPAAPGALRVAASGPALGATNRWLSPTTDGKHWLAVHTPHIGGVLHEYRREGDRLLANPVVAGVSNHRIGSRELDLAAWQAQRLLIPDQARRRVFVLDGRSAWRQVHEWPLPSPVAATASLGVMGGVAILHEDGSVALARVAA